MSVSHFKCRYFPSIWHFVPCYNLLLPPSSGLAPDQIPTEHQYLCESAKYLEWEKKRQAVEIVDPLKPNLEKLSYNEERNITF